MIIAVGGCSNQEVRSGFRSAAQHVAAQDGQRRVSVEAEYGVPGIDDGVFAGRPVEVLKGPPM